MFKVGDRVVRIFNPYDKTLPVGQVCVVTKVNTKYNYIQLLGWEGEWYHPLDFKLHKESKKYKEIASAQVDTINDEYGKGATNKKFNHPYWW